MVCVRRLSLCKQQCNKIHKRTGFFILGNTCNSDLFPFNSWIEFIVSLIYKMFYFSPWKKKSKSVLASSPLHWFMSTCYCVVSLTTDCGVFSEQRTASLVSSELVFNMSYVRNLAKDFFDTSSSSRGKKKNS